MQHINMKNDLGQGNVTAWSNVPPFVSNSLARFLPQLDVFDSNGIGVWMVLRICLRVF